MIMETLEECKTCNGYGRNIWGVRCRSCEGDGAVYIRQGIPNGRSETVPFFQAKQQMG